MRFRRALGAVFACLAFAALSPASAEGPVARVPDQVDFSTFFMADVRDSPECQAHLAGGRVGFGETITNPALTCPDAFAWNLFVASVSEGFWENWSTNRQTWPSDPWPRCKPGETGQCCAAVEISNVAWPEHCPVFPGATAGLPQEVATEPAIARQITLANAAQGDADGDGKAEWEDVPRALRTPVIGDLQGELVYRNEAMVDYIFDRGFYSADGLARVFGNLTSTAGSYAPRWPEPDDPAASYPAPPPVVSMVFPVKSVMIKVDWLSVADAAKVGIDPYDAANPYIIMNLVPQANANTPPSEQVRPTPHILLSMHISSKDLPQWFWATFEHVANQGRCDWTGCNDSFGYLVAETADVDKAQAEGLAPPARNFTPPHKTQKVAGLDQLALVLGDRYLGVDAISPAFDAILKGYGIGTGSGINQSGRPTPQDLAWRSYRLKGTQTSFVTATGRATHLGNSVTEAGFVSSASCISCHARAGATKEGTPPLAIFEDTLSDLGLPLSVNGLPTEAWFNVNAYRDAVGTREAPGIRAVQTDFVWGFRNACPMTLATGPSWCAHAIKRPK